MEWRIRQKRGVEVGGEEKKTDERRRQVKVSKPARLHSLPCSNRHLSSGFEITLPDSMHWYRVKLASNKSCVSLCLLFLNVGLYQII